MGGFPITVVGMVISDKPWSRFSESDYNPDQWFEACLIKPPESEYTVKSQAKLPVREPDGTLNRNAVHAAAAALAGARGDVKASPEKKHKAANGHKPYYEKPAAWEDIALLSLVEIITKKATCLSLTGGLSGSSGTRTARWNTGAPFRYQSSMGPATNMT